MDIEIKNMKKPLLIEIGVEELPAIPFLKELPNFNQKWSNVLKNYSLESEFTIEYTPRRIVIIHKEFSISQDDKIQEMFGAPISIAYKDGVATKACEGFAKKCGISIDKIEKNY